MRLRNPSVLAGLLLGLFFLSLYLVTGSSDLRHNGDTDLRYQTAQAVFDQHHIWIAHPLWTDTRVATGVGGHLYAFYAPGQPLLMVPLYAAGKALANHLRLPYDITTLYATRSLDLILGALLVVAFYLMALAVGYRLRVAVLLSLIFGLATAVWPDAQSGLEQTQVDLFLLLAVYSVWRFVRDGFDGRGWLALAGVAAGLAIFTRYDAVLYLPLVALFPTAMRFVRHRPGIIRDWIWFTAGLLPWVALVGLWDWARFGSPFLTGLHERTLGEPFWQGFLGLTISPGKGLIWYVPLLFLLPWAVSGFVRRLPGLALFFAALVLFPILFYSHVLYWHGDPSWGPRYLYVALPYLVLPVGEILTRWRERQLALRVALVAAVVLSIGLQIASVSVTQWRFWYRVEVMQQQGANAALWTGQPFHWGALRYHYYWNVRQSPIILQVDDLYQVVRLDTGDQRYRLAGWPDPYVSSPAANYPINTLAFWWADVRHPILSAAHRALIAAALATLALLSLLGLARLLWGSDRQPVRALDPPTELAAVTSSR